MPLSSWLMGSHANVPETVLTVTANSVAEDVTIPAGSYYVDDPTAARSLLSQLATAIASHSEVGACTASVCRDRLVRVNCTDGAAAALPFTVTFGGSVVRDVIGAGGNWNTSQATQVASEPSRHMWVAGKQENYPKTPVGLEGWRSWHYHYSRSGPSSPVLTNQQEYQVWQLFQWRHVTNYPTARVWDSAEAPGQFVAFFRNVIRRAFRMKLYRQIENDESDDTSIDFSSATVLGPYIGLDMAEEYVRSIANSDARGNVELRVRKCADFE